MQFAKTSSNSRAACALVRVPTEAEEQKRAIHRQREQLVQARKRLEAPVITSVYRQRCARYGDIANDVQPPSDGCNDKQGKSKNRRLAPQAARWEFPAGGSFVNSLLVFTQHRRIFRILGHLFKLRMALVISGQEEPRGERRPREACQR